MVNIKYISSTSNIDSVADVGTHSTFANQQTASDSTYDLLSEANTDTGTSTMGTNGSSGNSYRTTAVGEIRMGSFTASSSGEVASITFYGKGASATNAKGIITNSSGTLLTNGVGSAVSISTTAGSKVLTFAVGYRPLVTSGTTYRIGVIGQAALWVYYSSTTGGTSKQDTTNNYATPTNPTDAGSTTETWRQMYASINNLNYKLQIEEQFTSVPSCTGATLKIVTGTFSALDTMSIEIWYNSAWTSLGNVLASTTNSYDISSYFSGNGNAYIRFYDNTSGLIKETRNIDSVWLEYDAAPILFTEATSVFDYHKYYPMTKYLIPESFEFGTTKHKKKEIVRTYEPSLSFIEIFRFGRSRILTETVTFLESRNNFVNKQNTNSLSFNELTTKLFSAKTKEDSFISDLAFTGRFLTTTDNLIITEIKNSIINKTNLDLFLLDEIINLSIIVNIQNSTLINEEIFYSNKMIRSNIESLSLIEIDTKLVDKIKNELLILTELNSYQSDISKLNKDTIQIQSTIKKYFNITVDDLTSLTENIYSVNLMLRIVFNTVQLVDNEYFINEIFNFDPIYLPETKDIDIKKITNEELNIIDLVGESNSVIAALINNFSLSDLILSFNNMSRTNFNLLQLQEEVNNNFETTDKETIAFEELLLQNKVINRDFIDDLLLNKTVNNYFFVDAKDDFYLTEKRNELGVYFSYLEDSLTALDNLKTIISYYNLDSLFLNDYIINKFTSFILETYQLQDLTEKLVTISYSDSLVINELKFILESFVWSMKDIFVLDEIFVQNSVVNKTFLNSLSTIETINLIFEAFLFNLISLDEVNYSCSMILNIETASIVDLITNSVYSLSKDILSIEEVTYFLSDITKFNSDSILINYFSYTFFDSYILETLELNDIFETIEAYTTTVTDAFALSYLIKTVDDKLLLNNLTINEEFYSLNIMTRLNTDDILLVELNNNLSTNQFLNRLQIEDAFTSSFYNNLLEIISLNEIREHLGIYIRSLDEIIDIIDFLSPYKLNVDTRLFLEAFSLINILGETNIGTRSFSNEISLEYLAASFFFKIYEDSYFIVDIDSKEFVSAIEEITNVIEFNSNLVSNNFLDILVNTSELNYQFTSETIEIISLTEFFSYVNILNKDFMDSIILEKSVFSLFFIVVDEVIDLLEIRNYTGVYFNYLKDALVALDELKLIVNNYY